MIFSTIATKGKLGKGIVTAIFQVIGSIGAHMYVAGFGKMQIFAIITAPENQLDQAVADFYAEQIPYILLYLFGFMLYLAGVILMLVYVIPFLKKQPKVCGVFALIITILRIVVIQPFNMYHMFEQATEATQKSWDVFYILFSMLPAILVSVVGLITMLKKPSEETKTV